MVDKQSDQLKKQHIYNEKQYKVIYQDTEIIIIKKIAGKLKP